MTFNFEMVLTKDPWGAEPWKDLRTTASNTTLARTWAEEKMPGYKVVRVYKNCHQVYEMTHEKMCKVFGYTGKGTQS